MSDSNVDIDLEYYKSRLDLDNKEELKAFERLEQLMQLKSTNQVVVNDKKELVDPEDRFWNQVPEMNHTPSPSTVDSYKEFREYTRKIKTIMSEQSHDEQRKYKQHFLTN